MFYSNPIDYNMNTMLEKSILRIMQDKLEFTFF